MKEQRKYTRRFTAMNVDCYNAEGTKAIDTCLLVNISKGGVAIESRKTFQPKEKLLLKFISPDGRQFYILTEVLYSGTGGFGNLYGVRYCETNLKTLADFNAYLLKYFNLY